MFANTPNLYCEIKNRIVLGNKVIDREHVRFGEKYSDMIAVYEITEGKISKVTFVVAVQQTTYCIAYVCILVLRYAKRRHKTKTGNVHHSLEMEEEFTQFKKLW